MFADTYNVYQGTIDNFRLLPPYDHGCSESGLTPPLMTTVPTATCGDRLDLYFLIVGANALGEGPYGFDSAGGVRPPGVPLCP